MQVHSFLVQGTGAALAAHLSRLPSQLDALVLFSLGADHATLLQAVKENSNALSASKKNDNVYLTETYGILGFDADLDSVIELMEKGRGSEYGYVGGSGGQGCLVVGYTGGVLAGHDGTPPAESTSCMVIADQSKAWQQVQSQAPLHYGGITKACWRVNEKGTLESVPYFWIADKESSVGVSIFAGDADAGEVTKSLLQMIPSGREATGSIGLFPCFTRGVNQYGAENVESESISRSVPNARVYGMFAHGELGPQDFVGFAEGPNKIACTQHSMTSILAVHTSSVTGSK